MPVTPPSRSRNRHFRRLVPAACTLTLLGTAGAVAAGTASASSDAPAAASKVNAAAPTTAAGAAEDTTDAGDATATAGKATRASDDLYVGKVEVVRTADAPRTSAGSTPTLTGRVFEDSGKDSRSHGEGGDDGVEGVLVTNGRDVVKSDADGRYRLPAFDNMTVTITQPAGYQVPVDEHNIAQFHYHHLPAGSPKLRFGGLAPTGPLPREVNFPLVESAATADSTQSCVMAGDLQTYSQREIGYSRDGAVKDLADRGPLGGCGALFLGDVAGDDLGLYPRMKSVVGLVDGPVRFLPGNHDIDFDSTDPAHSFDTFRAHMGPEYYSYDVGDVHVVALNDVRYPCTPDVDNADGRKPECNDPENEPVYNGRLDEDQLAWLRNDLANVPQDKLVVLASHIPFLTFADMSSPRHQLDQVKQVHALVKGRKAVHVSGHTHSLENMKTGDSYGPWKEVMGVDALPFPHIVAGAISGDWYSGDLDENGLPMAYQRDGARPGLLTLDIEGNAFKERFTLTGESSRTQLGLGVNSPRFRQWFAGLDAWRKANPNDEERVTPPANYNDLGDPNMVTKNELTAGTWLTTNFFIGATDSTVEMSIDGGRPIPAQRTQPAEGEGQRVGAEYADPTASIRQLSVNRTAQESLSGDEQAQGYRLYRGSRYGPGPARPGNNLADRTHHLWRADLPENLAEGVHHVTVKATDSYGRTFTDTLALTVVEKRPQMEFRTQLLPTED